MRSIAKTVVYHALTLLIDILAIYLFLLLLRIEQPLVWAVSMGIIIEGLYTVTHYIFRYYERRSAPKGKTLDPFDQAEIAQRLSQGRYRDALVYAVSQAYGLKEKDVVKMAVNERAKFRALLKDLSDLLPVVGEKPEVPMQAPEKQEEDESAVMM